MNRLDTATHKRHPEMFIVWAVIVGVPIYCLFKP